MPPTLVGVGIGPGDPELITVRALRTLRAADRVFAPTMAAASTGRAESVVRRADPGVALERLVFAIDGDEAARAAAHAAAARRVAACLDAGETVAFVTLGDPNIYSTFHHLAEAVRRLRPATAVATVPGIMAFQELAALSGTVVVDGNERLHLVTGVDGPAALDDALADPSTAVVVYKGGRHLPQLARRLAQAGRLQGAVLGELMGLPGQRVVAVEEAAGAPAGYLAAVVVPPQREVAGS